MLQPRGTAGARGHWGVRTLCHDPHRALLELTLLGLLSA